MTLPRAQFWHLLTAVVTIAAIALQLVLVIRGGQVLDEVEPPELGLRLARFIAYFTVQSNVLVAISAVTLARDPLRDGQGWRVLRLAGIVGITVTGLVHFVLLRPLLDLGGADWTADKLLHMVVPVLALIGWGVFGPRPRITRREVGLALLWPLAWLGVTLTVGGLSGWFPYPFLDHREDGAGAVAVTSLGVLVLFFALFSVASYLDRRLTPSPTTAAAD
ncbi:Pr6Pr family membrane protein [Nocardioides sp.]|uniref:Pr6Pr family membrane protein n=1 Tax=Nocardioides sp. TaxID=35761 RepID=UPI002B270ADD|nr:Pr6Pr family membrane protein [Nocardioides sp.]